jgi:ferredoxin, 2Fe-2S
MQQIILPQAMTDKKIHFFPMDISAPIGRASSVLEVALRANVDIGHSCGGMGSCTTCRVFIDVHHEPLPERGELELEITEGRGFAENERLSCQLPPQDGMVVRVPPALTGDGEELA